MTVRIDSSTDTPEQVTAALGKDAPKKDPAPKEPAAPKTAPAKKDDAEVAHEAATENATAEEPAVGEEQEEGTKEGDPPPKKKGGFQKKIDKLTKRAQEAELENAHLKRMLQEGPKPDAKKDAAPAKDPAKRPVPDDYESHADYIEAITDWKVEQKLAATRKEEADKKLVAERGEKVKSWNQRLEKAREAHEDFDEALAADVPVSPAMMECMVDSELGAELAYWLGTHPDDARRIAQMSPTATARELGRIEARLEKPKEEEAVTTEKSAKVAASVKPKPVAPVGGRATPTAAKDPDKMSYQEFKKWRESQLAESARS